MGEIIFVLGGTRSGKSEYAEELAIQANNKVAYIATCICSDKEMESRIDIHKKRRPVEWTTFEEPRNIANLVPTLNKEFNTALIDCLTIYTSNLMFDNLNKENILTNIKELLTALQSSNCKSIIVSNEVGLGIVPESAMGREFRDIAGEVNKLVASQADTVFFVVSGIPMKIK